MKKQILSNLSSNYISKFISIALAFFIVPFLTRKLGKEIYGITVLAESTILFFNIISNSLKVALTRFSTFALSEGKKQEFTAYLSSGRFLLIGCAAFVLIAGGFLSYFYPYFIKIDPEYLRETRLLFLMVTFGFSVIIPNSVFSAVLYAQQRPDLVNMSVSFSQLLRGFLIFSIYSFFPTHSMLPYGGIYIASNLAQNLFVYLLSRRLMPDLRIRLSLFNIQKAKHVLGFSWHTSISHLSELLYDNTALVIIGAVWGPLWVAIYSISIRFSMTMKRLFLEAAWTLIPTFVDLAAKKDYKRMENLFIFYTKIMSIINTPVCLSLILMAKPLILLWVGKDFQMAASLVPFHIFPIFMAIPFAVCGCVIYAYAKVKIPSFVSLGMGILNVFIGLLFGVVFSWGLYGIAAGAALSSVLYLAAFFPVYACKISGVSIPKYIYRSFIKPAGLCCLVMGTGIWILRAYHVVLDINLRSFLILGTLIQLNWLIAFLFSLDRYEQKNILEILKLSLPKKTPKTPLPKEEMILSPEPVSSEI